MSEQPYTWRLGDVFTNGKYQWAVDSVHGDRAILQSCDTKWARTIYLTVDEWIDGGKWQLETVPVIVSEASGSVPSAAQE